MPEEFKPTFRKANDGIHTVYVRTDEEPMSITIYPSGWIGLYHVIVEYGDLETAIHDVLTAEQIKEKWDIDPERRLM